MASLQSMISVIFLVVPMLAPTIGQGILLFAGWRWIFGFMALLGAMMGIWVWRRLPETLHPAYRQPIVLRVIGVNIRDTVSTRASIGYVMALAATTGVMWGYVQSSQQLVAEHFGAGTAFPLFFGGMALCMACANFANSKIVERFGARRVAHTAMFGYTAFALAQFALAHGGHETLWQFVIVQTLAMVCGGFMGANFASIALQPFARIAGSAASVQTFLRNSLAGVMGAAIGQAYDGTARPFSTALVATSLGVIALTLWSERGRLFRRLNPPGTVRPVG
jgi:DHA1 family bicyclomycin/chloramphenicol resistance-like MFS transporter